MGGGKNEGNHRRMGKKTHGEGNTKIRILEEEKT